MEAENIEHPTLNAEPRRVERWITIGTVQAGWFVFERQSGTPNGFMMIWQGSVSAFQPREFRKWEHVLWAVERRLRLSNMQWVAIASEVPKRAAFVAVRVLVRRSAEAPLRKIRMSGVT